MWTTRHVASPTNSLPDLRTRKKVLQLLFSFFQRSPMIWSFLGEDTRFRFWQASTQTKANLGFGGTFTNLFGASLNLAIWSGQPNQIKSSNSNFTHCKQTIYSYNPIPLDYSRLIVYRCPYRVSLCLTHHPHPALLANCKVIRVQRPYSIRTKYLGIWSNQLTKVEYQQDPKIWATHNGLVIANNLEGTTMMNWTQHICVEAINGQVLLNDNSSPGLEKIDCCYNSIIVSSFKCQLNHKYGAENHLAINIVLS